MTNQEHWSSRKWRPYMAWTYMGICILDFAVFPFLWSILQAYYGGQVVDQWDPLTLKGAGLFHMAMGAVLGVTAWSRGQEKIAGVNNGFTLLGTSSTESGLYTPKPTPRMFTTTATVEDDPPYRNTRND